MNREEARLSVMGAISMALKDPTLQKGFECICKNLTELEKEHTELKTDYEVLSCSVGDFGELQGRLEEEQRKNNGLEEQLTKAKGHIRKLLDCLQQDTNDPQTNYYICQYMDKAEQFLSEEN